MIVLRDCVVTRGKFELNVPSLELSGGRNFLIGRNGAGKTTLLHSIAGLIESKGTIEVNGKDINELPPEKRGIGLIPQNLLLFKRMTVEENIRASIRYAKGDEAIYREVVREMDMTPLLEKRVSEISMGEAQRVAIARAMVSKPSVLLMDEPFSFQDEIARLEMISLIDEFSKIYGFEYIYATHNSRDLDSGFTNLVSIDNGKLVEIVDSMENVKHFRTYSLLDYRNLVSLDGRFFILDEDCLEFNDIQGSPYEIIGNNSNRYIRFKLGGKYYFATPGRVGNGRYVRVNLDRAREIPF